MVDGHAYKDHGIDFEDFFNLNFHIEHFLCSLKSVSRLKAMKSCSMQCVEADLHESQQDKQAKCSVVCPSIVSRLVTSLFLMFALQLLH
jgi:hypothetical protein